MNEPSTTQQEIGDVVARASGRKLGDMRWTVLTIYYVEAYSRHGYPFLAEIVGETMMPDEERRCREKTFSTLAKALNWGAFNAKTALFGELRNKALAWMEAQARDVSAGGSGSGLVPIPFGGSTTPETPLQELEEIADGAYGDGPAKRGLARDRLSEIDRQGYPPEATWVSDMRAHYAEHGFYRPEDLERVLGRPWDSVTLDGDGNVILQTSTPGAKR